MNKTLYFLWFSDVVLLTGFGLISPILAIFIASNIAGGSIMTAGIASALFLSVKAIIQIPFSRYIDSHRHKVLWLHIGTFLIATVPFQYYFAHTITSIYIAQVIYGIGAGLAAPAWLSLWSRHLDKDHEGFEWSLYSATVGLGTGFSAFVGGTLATYIGFKHTVLFMGVLAIVGFFVLLGLDYDDKEPETIAAPAAEMTVQNKHKFKHVKIHHK